MESPAQRRWRELSADAPREDFFAVLRDAVAEYYLADPGNPYRQSGRSSGAARWEETRRCLVAAVHKAGDFLDVGCANGLLLESLRAWSPFPLRLHGVDFVPELAALARARVPDGQIHAANAFEWDPPQRYDFVRTNLDIVPEADRAAFVRRQERWVAPGGRLIVCYYRDQGAPDVDAGAFLRSLGYDIAGWLRTPIQAAWIDVAPESSGLMTDN